MPHRPWKLCCTECGVVYDPDDVRYVCPRCADAQEPGGWTRGVLEVVWDPDALARGWRKYAEARGLRGIERVRPLLPLADAAPELSLLVGDTPLVAPPRLRAHLQMPALWIKDETRNPSASYKDRASALVCLKAAELGEPTIVAASTGNAATALSCIAAALGQRAVILVPSSAPRAKLVQMLCYGADVVPVDGTYDQAFELSLAATRELGWYNRNTAFNPFTIEGKKTAAFEIVDQLGGAAPDVVVVPTGDGVILSGIAKGFRDLVAAGAIARVPRMLAVQAEGSAAIAHAVRGGGALEAVPDAHTVADSICVAAPRAGLLAVREIRSSGGGAVVVSDEAVVAAIGELARFGGIFAEPAGAASLAGLTAALREGIVTRDQKVVLMVTGHGLKDVASATRCVTVPQPIAPDPDALRARLASGA